MTSEEGGWGWVVVTAAFTTLTIIQGATMASFSVLYRTYAEVFTATSAEVGWVISIQQFVLLSSTLLVSPWIEKYGCRRLAAIGVMFAFVGMLLASASSSLYILYITLGIITGFGAGMCNMTCVLIPQQYFVKKRALAGGITVTGMSVAVLAFVPITEVLMGVFGWRGTIMMLAACVVHMLPCVALYRPPRVSSNVGLINKQYATASISTKYEANIAHSNEIDINPEKNSTSTVCENDYTDDKQADEIDVSHLPRDKKHIHSVTRLCSGIITWLENVLDFSLLRNPRLCLYITGTCLVNVGLFTAYAHTVRRAVYIGLTQKQAAFIGSCIGIGGLVSRLVMMFPLSTGKMNLIWAYSCGQMAGGFVLCAHYFVTGLAGNTTMSIIYGVTEGIWISVQMTSLRDLIGLGNLTRACSLLFTALGISVLLAVPFTGWLYDISGDYNVSFVVAGIFQVAGSLLCSSIGVMNYVQRKTVDVCQL